MVTEGARLSMCAAALCAVLAGSALADGPPAPPAGLTPVAHAEALVDARQYREAVEVLEALIERGGESAAVQLLLGKAYGRLAEREPWYRAVGAARRCGRAFERAVELEPGNREALAVLARFYEEAPAIVGGGAERAAEVRRRLEALE